MRHLLCRAKPKATNIQLVLAILSLLLISACSQQPAFEQMQVINGQTMGTSYSVKYFSPESGDIVSNEQLKATLDERLVNINLLMSTYIEDSELSLLNQAPANQAFALSSETAQVIQKALEIGELSSGALDITVGPIVNLWGFGPDKRPEVIPSEEDIAAVAPFVGADKFRLENNRIIKSHENVYIDLSTIAKGYGVDEMADILESYGIRNYLVEIGGEMRLSGKKPQGEEWAIAIEKPISSERAVQRIINIGDNAIATSGDYRNYVEQDGVRFSHLIDPTTAAPIQHNLVAVSVIAPTCIEADGLATALIVMGSEAGKALAEKHNIAAIFISKEGNEFVESRSTAFEQQVNIVQ